MTAESVCFAALPAALPASWGDAVQASSGEEVVSRRLALAGLGGGEAELEMQASFLAPRLLPRLFRDAAQTGSPAQKALEGAQRLVILLPAGRYDDGVWAPIIERILLGLGERADQPREIILAWSGFDPFLVPFGRRVQEVWSDPRLVPALLGVLERSARSLATVLDELGAGLGVRRGLIRFDAAQADGPPRAVLALA